MFKENLVVLRGVHGYSQEEIAGKINISRQAYAKWESGATIPDIEKCRLLADVYGVTIDRLINSDSVDTDFPSTFDAKGKDIWGSITINDRGQIVIPKGAREKFNLVGGTRLIVLSDDDGIALIKSEKFEEKIHRIMELASIKNEKE